MALDTPSASTVQKANHRIFKCMMPVQLITSRPALHVDVINIRRQWAHNATNKLIEQLD